MTEELKKREPMKIVPGSDIHFALLGVPWHFNMLRGQDYADMMGFAEAVWNAALQHAAPPASTGVVRDARRLIGWRTDDYLEETADPKMARNWEVHHNLLPIFEGDPHTKLAAPTYGGDQGGPAPD